MGKERINPIDEAPGTIKRKVLSLNMGVYDQREFVYTYTVGGDPCVVVADHTIKEPKAMRWYAERLLEAANIFDKV